MKKIINFIKSLFTKKDSFDNLDFAMFNVKTTQKKLTSDWDKYVAKKDAIRRSAK